MLARKPAPKETTMERAAQAVGETAQGIQETAQQVLPPGPAPEFGGFNAFELGLSLAIILLALTVRALLARVIEWIFLWRVRRSEHELNQRVYEAALRLVSAGVILAGLYFAFGVVELPSKPVDWSGGVWRFYSSIAVVFVCMVLFRIASVAVTILARQRGVLNQGLVDRQFAPLLRDLARIAASVLGIILIVQTWGYDATALIAGVGLGGLAVAFAAQDAIANMFGSLVVYSDRPFKLGDWVKIGDTEGVVEEIGIRSTRVRMFDKSIASVPNKLVTSEKIINFSAMTHRRIRQVITLDHSTQADKLEASLEAIRACVAKQESIEPETWAVSLSSLGTTGFDLLLLCYCTCTEWQDYIAVQEQLLLAIRRALGELGVELAEPLMPR